MGIKSNDNEVRSEKHSSEVDTNSINRATEKVSKDSGFIDTAISLIKEIKFPAYKKDIINQAKHSASTSPTTATTTTDSDTIALFHTIQRSRSCTKSIRRKVKQNPNMPALDF
jgi:hypothetical protein